MSDSRDYLLVVVMALTVPQGQGYLDIPAQGRAISDDPNSLQYVGLIEDKNKPRPIQESRRVHLYYLATRIFEVEFFGIQIT